MIPILSSSTTLTGNGLGRLSDAISCIVTHEINGEYELQMTYPVTGNIFSSLANDCVIWADTDNFTAKQGFRIYRITRPLNGVVSVYARHICYDMSGYVCPPISQNSLTTALAALASSCVPSGCPFTFTSPRTVATAYKTVTPMSLWQMMGGIAGSLLDVYGGEWDFNNYTATLRTTLGSDRGVAIRYGKNMTELEQDASIEAQYGGIFPYWYDGETGTLVTLPENYVTVAGGGSRVLCIDFSNDFDDKPTVSQLRNRANTYASANKVGDVAIQWKVAFVPLQQSAEYKNIAALEAVQLGDTVHVYYEPMNLTASARVVKTEYNVLVDRFETVTLGRVKQNLAKIVTEQKRDIDHTIGLVKSTLEHAIDEATDFITNGAGYMRFVYNSNDELTEIVSLDNSDINQAASVWRWNNGGFGHSTSGYGGPYTTAITQNGAIVADFITSGTLNANVIRAGILQDANGDNSWNLATGAFTITNGSINISTNDEEDDIIQLNATVGGTTWTLEMTPSYVESSSQGYTSIFSYSGVYSRMFTTPVNYTNHLYVDGPSIGLLLTNSSGERADVGEDSIVLQKYVSGSFSDRVNISNTPSVTLSEGTDTLALNKTTLTLTTSSKTTTFSAGLIQFTNSGTLAIYNGSSSKYGALIWPDGNGAGRVVLGDGTSTTWRTSLENTGLVFRDASNNVTGTYPSDGLDVPDLNGCQTELVSNTSTAKTYTLGSNGTYLLTITRANNSATTYDGVWIISKHSTSHLYQIAKGSSAPSPSVSGATLSLTTTSSNQRITITKLS